IFFAQPVLGDREKDHLVCHGLEVAAFRAVDGWRDLEQGFDELGRQAVLKTRRFGYDGKGQWMLDPDSRLDDIAKALGDRPAVLEARIAFEREISVLVARRPGGETITFPPVENQHQNHILKRTIAPAPIPADLAATARRAALTIAQSLDLEGLLAVEMFVAADGRLLINELAPRPHNSGHWTIEGCNSSQFEAHVRSVCDLPLIEPEMLFPAVTMDNLLGDEIEGWTEILAESDTYLHLYGKSEARPGRKMGHVTRLQRF
ncbi:MAG: ATP-grasp domain-containing protein, partial [Pseudomonadota bacterium]